jgi:amidophosphoribosyltransferase
VNTDELFALVNIEPGEFQKQSDLAAMMEVIQHFLIKADETSPDHLNFLGRFEKSDLTIWTAALQWAD